MDVNEIFNLIIAALGGGGITSLVNWRLHKRKEAAEVKQDEIEVIRKTIDECGNKYFIPCIAQGGPGSIYDGVYDAIMAAIDDYNVEHFGIKREEIVRAPLQYEKNGYM